MGGYTLLEMMGVIAIMGIIAAVTAPKIAQLSDDKVAGGAAENMRQISIAAREHHQATGAWPADINVLIAANRVTPTMAMSSFDTPWVFTVLNGGNLFRVSVDTTDPRFATRLAGADLPFMSQDGNTISTDVTRAGQEAAHDTLYSLDGSKALTGTMNANDQDINNVNSLKAKGITATSIGADSINTGDLTATGQIQAKGGINVTGQIVSTENTLRRVNLTGESVLSDLEVKGSTKIMGEFLLGDNTNKEGQTCGNSKAVALTSDGDLLTCKGSKWAKGSGDSGSEVITGAVNDGDSIPVVKGYTVADCQFSLGLGSVDLGTWDKTFQAATAVVVSHGATPPTASCGWYRAGGSNGVYVPASCTFVTACNRDITKLSGTTTPKGTTYIKSVIKTYGSANIEKESNEESCFMSSMIGGPSVQSTFDPQKCGPSNQAGCPTSWIVGIPSSVDKGSYYQTYCGGAADNAQCTYKMQCTVK